MLLQDIFKNNLNWSYSDFSINQELAKQIQVILIEHNLLFPLADGVRGNKSLNGLKTFLKFTEIRMCWSK